MCLCNSAVFNTGKMLHDPKLYVKCQGSGIDFTFCFSLNKPIWLPRIPAMTPFLAFKSRLFLRVTPSRILLQIVSQMQLLARRSKIPGHYGLTLVRKMTSYFLTSEIFRSSKIRTLLLPTAQQIRNVKILRHFSHNFQLLWKK